MSKGTEDPSTESCIKTQLPTETTRPWMPVRGLGSVKRFHDRIDFWPETSPEFWGLCRGPQVKRVGLRPLKEVVAAYAVARVQLMGSRRIVAGFDEYSLDVSDFSLALKELGPIALMGFDLALAISQVCLVVSVQTHPIDSKRNVCYPGVGIFMVLGTESCVRGDAVLRRAANCHPCPRMEDRVTGSIVLQGGPSLRRRLRPRARWILRAAE